MHIFVGWWGPFSNKRTRTLDVKERAVSVRLCFLLDSIIVIIDRMTICDKLLIVQRSN